MLPNNAQSKRGGAMKPLGDGFSLRACGKCGHIFVANSNGYNALCKKCSKRKKAQRSDRHRFLKKRRMTVANEQRERFEGARWIMFHDPSNCYTPGTFFRTIDLENDLVFGNFEPETIIYDRRCKTFFVITGNSGERQQKTECIVSEPPKKDLTYEQASPIITRGDIVIVFKPGYNELYKKLISPKEKHSNGTTRETVRPDGHHDHDGDHRQAEPGGDRREAGGCGRQERESPECEPGILPDRPAHKV